MDVKLPTWTRTLNERDAYDLLDLAQPGMGLDEFRERAHTRLPQPSRARRQELLREVERDLLDHDGATILPSRFLELVHTESPAVRQGLFIGRLFFARPALHVVFSELLGPARLAAAQPLAPLDAGKLDAASWDSWLGAVLPEGTGRPAHDKTRQTLQRHLALAGCVTTDGRGGTCIAEGRPAPLAYAWLVAYELVKTNRREAPEAWATSHSFATRLFGPTEAYARVCIDSGVHAGLLTRGYLAGAPRLHPALDVTITEVAA